MPIVVKSPGLKPIEAQNARSSSASVSYLPSTHRSEEHTSELQSLRHLVCRLLLEKKKPEPRCRLTNVTPSRPRSARLGSDLGVPGGTTNPWTRCTSVTTTRARPAT